MALKGDTIRLTGEFKDFDKNFVEPESVTLNIYDKSNIAIQSITITTDNRIGIGLYYYDYVVPFTIEEFFICEFLGMYRGNPILDREKISVSFV